MINKISIKGPASYKNMAVFETDKNINLIYGLNGSGKSTLSEFLRKRTDNEYAECSISPLLDEDAEEILVYNENYVNDVFYSSDTQKEFSLYQRRMQELEKELMLLMLHCKLQTEIFKNKNYYKKKN